jgi:hypothetical protein
MKTRARRHVHEDKCKTRPSRGGRPEAFSCMKMTRSLRKISMADRLLPRIRMNQHVSMSACKPHNHIISMSRMK